VVFGKASGFGNIDLATLTAAQGFRIDGAMVGDLSGYSVASAGDVNGDGYETTDIMTETPTCALDDVMKIYPNHTVSFERHQRCVSSERPIETYKWKLAKDGTFTIIDGTIEAKMILKSANASRMVMWIPMEEDGEIYHFKVTYGQKSQQIPGKILKN
jgi:hypothetical protein